MQWTSSDYESTNITGTESAIGAGKANTAAILAIDGNAPAALACKNYDGGGMNDWFLPSRGELNEMYKARSHLGISSLWWFWSSSQAVADRAWAHSIFSGDLDHFVSGHGRKTNDANVRAMGLSEK